MTIQVPDNLAAQAGCTTPELIFGLVVGLFFQGRLSLGQAGEALGLSKSRLMEQLHDLGLPMPYSADDASHDLDAINRVWPSTRLPADS
jgi:predicted HTH domain antitoxin